MSDFQVSGQVAAAPFTLTLHRGEGMCLLAMNWRNGRPPNDFVGFAIEYMEPGADRWWVLRNRLAFIDASQVTDKSLLSTKLCPIQKFRWVHFPQHPALNGDFSYRVTPVFMNPAGELSYGVAQTAAVTLARETYPGQLDISFTRGFVSSQGFADRYGHTAKEVATLIPPKATQGSIGLDFVSPNPKAQEAYDWMGFEARKEIIGLLDAAIADPAAQVRMIAYDLNAPEVVSRAQKLGRRLKIIVDDSDAHGKPTSAETEAFKRLTLSAGAANVCRQHLGGLQHNKFIVVDGPTVKKATCGSTNYSFRAFFVQSNNAITVMGAKAIEHFKTAFDAYFISPNDAVTFGAAGCGEWLDLGLAGIDAKVTFSPHGNATAKLKGIADDIRTTSSSLLYSLAFLWETKGVIKDAIKDVTDTADRFVYGISDKEVGGLDVQSPSSGNPAVVTPGQLSKNIPPPFSEEPSGGTGARMHHKFIVIDFDKPTARVYVGSYNFSTAADVKNGENLLVIHDRRATTAYAVEAIGIFDHYHFRDKSDSAATAGAPLVLRKPPSAPGEKPWFADDYEVAYKIKDRVIFA